MMMHHDGQPLYSREGMYGLLNQVNFLRKAGAQSMQVTVLTPAVGTRSYESNFSDGLVFDTVGGKPVLQYQFDGNHAVASNSAKPWRAQLNVLAAYTYFYNPINFLRSVLRPANTMSLAGAQDQLIGMLGLAKTAWESSRWAFRLWRGPITRRMTPPGPQKPMVDVSIESCRETEEFTPQISAPPALVQLGFEPRRERVAM
jgi:hypothetical protein